MDPAVVDWLRDGEVPADRDPAVAGRRPRRLRFLVIAAALPWVLVVVLAWRAATPDWTPPPPPDDAAIADVHPPAGMQPPMALPPPAATPPPGAAAGFDPALAAHAITAVRLRVTGEGAVRRYVDLAVAEAVEAVDDTVIVTVLAVLLEGDAERWTTTRLARYGVPLQLVDGQTVVLADPWPVATPEADPGRELGWVRADDPDAEHVQTALEHEGFSDLGEIVVEQVPDIPGVLRATVEARAPGASDAAVHAVWLRSGPVPAVLGSGDPP